MRNRGLSKLYLIVGIFISLVVVLIAIRVITANMNPEHNLTREDAEVRDTEATIPTNPAGAGTAEPDRSTNNAPSQTEGENP